MWVHYDANGTTTQVTADVDSGSVDHLVINNRRLMSTLGLRDGLQDTMSLEETELHLDETFTIKIPAGQQPPTDPQAWIVGELISARHAYLYWLDYRRSANPRVPPYISEARTLAHQLGRRAPDVWKEIENAWNLEQGDDGHRFRNDREKYLGENPSYPTEEEKAPTLRMWG